MDASVGSLVTDSVIARKLGRIAGNGQPRVLDLFSGCGGISLGFDRAGFSIDAAVEVDPVAARSHARNFHGTDPDQFALHAQARDITKVEPEHLADELGLGAVEDAVDVLVGGPPCQAYARVGRAKLREIAEHPKAYKIDPRGNLYLRYLDYVRKFRPLAILMENVPDILHYDGHNVVQEMVETLASLGYVARYSLINSAFHGVPQMRDRVFLIAYHRDLGVRPTFPRATNHMTLPPGYAGTRAVALRFMARDLVGGWAFDQADLGDGSLPGPVTAREAIGDLPFVRGDSVARGARRFGPETWMPYRKIRNLSNYARAMREWDRFSSDGGIVDHAIRFLPRDGYIFRSMGRGEEYPKAHELAMRTFEMEAKRLRLRESSNDWNDLKRKMVPPYDPSKFPNRWWKLKDNFPVRTLMAHIGKDTYSHIHYDGQQARTISVREAARLQSFPDGFRFEGTMNPAFRQIGNAVPPLMAAAFAEIIRDALRSAALRLCPASG